jgi:rhamnogalacturonyl hydrolase YesR
MSAGSYFDPQDAIGKLSAGKDELVLAAIANRFIGSHPKLPPVYRTYTTRGFQRGSDYRYEMNLLAKWPEMKDGQLLYVWGKLWSDQEADSPFSISCFGPVTVFVNDSQTFKSNLNDDVFPDRKIYFRTMLRKGWNHIVLELVKTGTGCGASFGTGSVKGFPMHILSPSAGREGQEGWVYSSPQNEQWATLPSGDGDLFLPDIWYPKIGWLPIEEEQGCFARIFGASPGSCAFAWAKLENSGFNKQHLRLKGLYDGPCKIYVDGLMVYSGDKKSGELAIKLQLRHGSHDLVVQSECSDDKWGFELKVEQEQAPATEVMKLSKPFPAAGLLDHWFYLGPFTADRTPEAAAITHMQPNIEAEGESVCWRVDRPDTWIRPYLENALFGKWNYPLGVTLYGILKTGAALSDPHFTNYAADHIEQCSSMYARSVWDYDRFGSPGTNHQLTLIDSLDDCGSFGAAMLEAHKVRKLNGAEQAAERIARYIAEEQDRQPDGTLFRARGTTDFMKDTIWCDDLYMSTPFLAKYYEMTGRSSYLDDAAEQFLLYKSKLFMPELQIMHHVYDYKFNKPNGVPWGRGNGWVLFSLSELLAVMPASHKRYELLMDFFRELCQGYERLQGEAGLWHQVLTDPESYGEASCTSMFLYAFARGVRFGWMKEDADRFVSSVHSGWEGLKNECIDKFGNVYGICRGSGYSYSALYYKKELSWQLNDTHGIGIVLLAGIEALRLREFCSSQTTH